MLVVALALVGLLGMLVLWASARARAGARLARAGFDSFRLRAAAGAAVRRAAERLAADGDPQVDHTNEAWAAAAEYTGPGGIRVRVEVIDEDRFFDLNNLAVPPGTAHGLPAVEVLERLLRSCGDPDTGRRVPPLRDWVDGDGEGPFETPAYAGDLPARACPDAPLTGWLEVASVRNWSAGYLADPALGRPGGRPGVPLERVATVVPRAARAIRPLNVNTAGPRVLAAVLRPAALAALLSMRDAAPLRSLDGLTLLVDPLEFERIGPWLDVRSTVFRLRAVAADGRAAAEVTAQAERLADGRIAFLRWTEGVPPGAP